jgi:hypothetical protein
MKLIIENKNDHDFFYRLVHLNDIFFVMEKHKKYIFVTNFSKDRKLVC